MKSKLLLIIVLVFGIAVGTGGVLLVSSKSSDAEGSCAKKTANSQSHQVMIMDSKVDNDHVTGKLCDSITFTNMDPVAREIAFGPHEDHVPYDGVAEKVLNEGQSFTITLNKVGSYHWHDHIHDEVEGYFTVTN